MNTCAVLFSKQGDVVNVSDYKGQTLLCRVVDCSIAGLCTLFLDWGASMDAENTDGEYYKDNVEIHIDVVDLFDKKY